MKYYLILFTALMLSFVTPSAGQSPTINFDFFGSNGLYNVYTTGVALRATGNDLILEVSEFGLHYNKPKNEVGIFFNLFSKDKDIMPHLKNSIKLYPSETTVITFDDFSEVRGIKIGKNFENDVWQYLLFIDRADSRVINNFLNKKMTTIRINTDKYWIGGSRYTPGLFCLLADTLEKKNNFKDLFYKLSGGVNIQSNIQTFKTYNSDNIRDLYISGPSTTFVSRLVWKIFGEVDPFSTNLSKTAVLKELKKAFPNCAKSSMNIRGRDVYDVKDHKIIYKGIRADPIYSNVQFEKGKLKCYHYSFILPPETKLNQLMMFAENIVNELNRYLSDSFEKFKDGGYDILDHWYFFKTSDGTINNVKCSIIVSVEKPQKKNDNRKEVNLSVHIE